MSSSSGSQTSSGGGNKCPDITKYNGCTTANCQFIHPAPDLSLSGKFAQEVARELIEKFGDRKCSRKQNPGFLSESCIAQIASCPTHSEQKLNQENTDESLCDLTCSDPTCEFHVEVKLASVGSISKTISIKVKSVVRKLTYASRF
jgi:hypothetical protein